MEHDEKYIQLYSDFENYKKRTKKEKENLIEETKMKMLDPILNIDNDLNIAIKSIKDDETKRGLLLIINKLTKALEELDIQEIQTNSYDSDLHEVVSITESDKEIADVVSKGYIKGDKIYRYAKIILGKK